MKVIGENLNNEEKINNLFINPIIYEGRVCKLSFLNKILIHLKLKKKPEGLITYSDINNIRKYFKKQLENE